MTRNILFDLLAPFYDRVSTPPSVEDYWDVLRLPIAGDLLDAGGGTGRASLLLRPYVRRLYLYDLSFPMLLQARAKNTHVCLRGMVDRLPFPANTFERILVVDALHHFPDQAQAMASLLRILKPGGRLVIEEPNVTTRPVKVIALLEKLAGMGSQIHTPAQIKSLIAGLGYHAVIQPYGRYTVWIIVDK